LSWTELINPYEGYSIPDSVGSRLCRDLSWPVTLIVAGLKVREKEQLSSGVPDRSMYVIEGVCQRGMPRQKANSERSSCFPYISVYSSSILSIFATALFNSFLLHHATNNPFNPPSSRYCKDAIDPTLSFCAPGPSVRCVHAFPPRDLSWGRGGVGPRSLFGLLGKSGYIAIEPLTYAFL